MAGRAVVDEASGPDSSRVRTHYRSLPLCNRPSVLIRAPACPPPPHKIDEHKPRNDEYADEASWKKRDSHDEKRGRVEYWHTLSKWCFWICRAHFLVASHPLCSAVPDQTRNEQCQYNPTRPAQSSTK